MAKWRKLRTEPPHFLFCDSSEVAYDFYITDYKNIWWSLYSKSAWIDSLKHSNKGLEIENDELLEKGWQLLMNPQEAKSVTINKADNDELLDLCMSVSYGYPLKLKIEMLLGSHKCFFDHVIYPLLNSVKDLRSSEHELRQLLLKKDQEIEEYKCEGGEIALRHLKTMPFNDMMHTEKHRVYNECFGVDGFPDTLLRVTELVKKPNTNTNGNIKNINGESSGTNIQLSTSVPAGISSKIKTEAISGSNINTEPFSGLKMETKPISGLNIKTEPVCEHNSFVTLSMYDTEKCAIDVKEEEVSETMLSHNAEEIVGVPDNRNVLSEPVKQEINATESNTVPPVKKRRKGLNY